MCANRPSSFRRTRHRYGVKRYCRLARRPRSSPMGCAKAKYAQGVPVPKSTTIIIEPAGSGIKTIVDLVSDDGTVRHYESTAKYDGKDNPVVGNSATGDVLARTRINATTTKTVNKKDG